MRRGNSKPGGDDTTELLTVTSVIKRFGGVQALRMVDINAIRRQSAEPWPRSP